MIIFKKLSFYLAVISLVAMGLMVWRMAQSDPKPPPVVPPPVKPHDNGIGASGIVEAIHDNTEIGAPIAGLVAHVDVKVWDRVKKGEPLFELDDRDLRAQMLIQEANIKVAEAQVRRATSAYKRLKSVSDPRAVSEGEVTARDDDVNLAEAQLDAAKAALEAAKIELDRMTVRSPIDGTVLQSTINDGEFVSPQMQSPPMVVGDIDDLQVRADVDEQIAPRVKEGKNAIGYLRGESSHPIKLTFVRIEPYVIPKKSLTGQLNERIDTRVLQVIFKFPNNMDRKVYVGQQMDLFIDE